MVGVLKNCFRLVFLKTVLAKQFLKNEEYHMVLSENRGFENTKKAKHGDSLFIKQVFSVVLFFRLKKCC